MEAVGENCVVTVSLRWEDFVVPGITKEPDRQTSLSRISVVKILHSLLINQFHLTFFQACFEN